MKLIITICCFLLFPLFSYSQFNTSIDFILGAENRDINDRLVQSGTKIINSKFGVNFNFRVSDRIVIKTGFRYSKIGTVEENFLLNILPPRISPTGPLIVCACRPISRHKSYFEIPLIARYEIGYSKFSHFIEMGLLPHFYKNTNLAIINNNISNAMIIRELEYGQKRMLMSYSISWGMNINFDENYQLFFQPILQMNSSEIYETGFIDSKNTIGVELGVRFALSSNS